MKFTDKLWKETREIYDKILLHPFNQELMKGILDEKIFSFYINQDSLYLVEFGKALAVTAGRATDANTIIQFATFANDAIVVERLLHKGYFEKFNIQVKREPSPTCFNYTNFLLAVCSTGNYEEAVTALLPCFWIYREVGNYIFKYAQENNKYSEWIKTYSSKDFTESVDKMIEITNKTANAVSQNQKNKMLEKFVYSVKLEYMFWDSAYKQEEWIQ